MMVTPLKMKSSSSSFVFSKDSSSETPEDDIVTLKTVNERFRSIYPGMLSVILEPIATRQKYYLLTYTAKGSSMSLDVKSLQKKLGKIPNYDNASFVLNVGSPGGSVTLKITKNAYLDEMICKRKPKPPPPMVEETPVSSHPRTGDPVFDSLPVVDSGYNPYHQKMVEPTAPRFTNSNGYSGSQGGNPQNIVTHYTRTNTDLRSISTNPNNPYYRSWPGYELPTTATVTHPVMQTKTVIEAKYEESGRKKRKRSEDEEEEQQKPNSFLESIWGRITS